MLWKTYYKYKESPPDDCSLNMKLELLTVSNFLIHLLADALSKAQQEQFQNACIDLLTRRFESGWNPMKPWRGSGFRTLHLHQFDPVISQICLMSHIPIDLVQKTLSKFPCTLFTDPLDVSYKMENGPLLSLYSGGDEVWEPKHIVK